MTKSAAPRTSQNLDIKAMQEFVYRCQREYGKGYNSGQVELKRAADGRRSSVIENDEFRLTDEFDGGNPYCGITRLMSKFNGRVTWNGYSHGWLTQKTEDTRYTVADIFNFLREALQTRNKRVVIRGASSYKNSEFTYTNALEFGDFECFYGHETIHNTKGTLLYYGRYGGGLVDIAEDTGEA